MTATTVTATGSGATAAGISLTVLVLRNAVIGTGTTQTQTYPAGMTNFINVATGAGADNSIVYSSTLHNGATTTDTAFTGSTAISTTYDATHGQARSVFSTPVSTASSGLLSVGAASGNGATSSNATMAWCEVDPVGGTITQDASSPATVNSNAASTVTTASFNPPGGSLLLAFASANAAAGTAAQTMTITSSITLNWNLAAGPPGGVWQNVNVSPEGLVAGIWYAIVPPTPVITTTNVPGGVVGSAYSFAFTGTSGTAPYTWAVTSGALPAGLSLSSAGVVTGTPSATGVSTFTVTLTDHVGQTTSSSFQIVVNANSTPGGVVRATWALAAGAYTYGTLEVPVSNQDHSWLFVSVSWMAGEDTGIAYVADSSHNLYQPTSPAQSTQANTQVFVVPNARATSVIYVSTSAFVRWLNVQITEVTGLQPGYVTDAFNVFTSGPAVSQTESLSTANADFILAVGALSGAPQTITQSGTGATWNALTGSFNGSSSAGITQSLAWAETTAAASPSMQFTGASGYWSGTMIAVKRSGGLPVNANPGWPVISARAAFGYLPQQPTAEPVWTDITNRFLGLNGQRGRSFELDEISAADLTCSFDNRDGALNPQNSASPFWPNVTLITPVEVLATWQGRVYVLFRGLITAVPQTYDFQRGLVQASLSDDFSKLPQTLLATCFIQEMLYDQPLYLWPLNEQQGAPYASNWSGRSNVTLTPAVAAGGPGVTIGGTTAATTLTVNMWGTTWPVSSTGITASTTGTTAATGTTTPSNSNTPATGFGNSQSGIYPGGLAATTDSVWGNTSTLAAGLGFQGTSLADINDANLPLTGTGATYAVWAQVLSATATTNTAARFITLTDAAGPTTGHQWASVLYTGTTVNVTQTSGTHTYTPPASLFDGNWHLWVVTVTTAGVITLYLDAVPIITFTGSFPVGNPVLLQFGGDYTASAFTQTGQFTGSMANAAVYDRVIDPERIQSWFLAGSTGFLDELAGTRIQRVLSWARWSTPQAIDAGLTLQQQFNYLTGGYASSGLSGSVGNFQTAGGSAAIDSGAQADMTIQDIANTDLGLLFLTSGGELFFRNKNNLSSFPAVANISDMDWPLNSTERFAAGLGEWTTAANCTLAESSLWSYMEQWSGLMTVTGTPVSASVTGGQWPIQGTAAGFSAWVMSPQGCYAQLTINWYGLAYQDQYAANYLDNYGQNPTFGVIGTTTGALTYLPPMTPVQLQVPPTAAPAGTTQVQGVITIGSSPATGTQLYFDRTRLSPAGFAVSFVNDSPGDLKITEDIQYLFNDIAVTRNVDQVAIRVRNQASRTRYFPRVYTRTIYSSADDPNALINCANTLLSNFATPQLRVQQVIIDAASNPELWPFVLGTDIGDLVQFTRTPVGAPGITGSFLVISVQPEIAPDKATFTYTLIPAGVF